jgi:predicted nucleotidyltransferase
MPSSMTSKRRSAQSAKDAVAFAEDFARSCSHALGASVRGIFLHGSLVLDDYVPGRSDVDLLIIVAERLGDAHVAALTEAADEERPRAPGRVDLRVVTQHAARAPTRLPSMEAYIRIASGCEATLYVESRRARERDLVIEFSMCRAHGRSLVGATPAEVIAPVPRAWVLDVGDAQLADWQEIGDDSVHAQLTVLTACRIWRFAEESRHCSKTAAGEWALGRDATLQAVRQALRRRHVDPTFPIDGAHVRHLLDVVRARLAGVRANRV